MERRCDLYHRFAPREASGGLVDSRDRNTQTGLGVDGKRGLEQVIHALGHVDIEARVHEGEHHLHGEVDNVAAVLGVTKAKARLLQDAEKASGVRAGGLPLARDLLSYICAPVVGERMGIKRERNRMKTESECETQRERERDG